ncbi:MAG TPA: septal ring lytic transglycosylase RlpA family protein [Acidimicrobiales bacterium]|nr:septal ring lytic transglycosylase RlpA family protein [Acidimicrobiales bacterium]
MPGAPTRMALTLAGMAMVAGLLAGPALSGAAGASVSPPGVTSSSLALTQARAAAVDLQIADLATRTQAAQAAALGADLAESRLQSGLAEAQARAAALLAEAYVVDAPDSDQAVPGPYLDAAQGVTDRILSAYHSDLAAARSDQTAARRRLGALELLQAQLADQRSTLEAIVGADQAELAREQSAQAAALARSDQARRAVAPALGPISVAATREQAALMARYPFGPVGPAGLGGQGGLEPGLQATGTVLAGVASWYGPGFDGQATATGAVYDESGWTVASPDLPLGTFLLVSHGADSVLLLVNDRGPYVAGRILDLSHAAALALGDTGLADVTAQVMVPVPQQ